MTARGVSDVRYLDTVLHWDAFVGMAQGGDVCLLTLRDGVGGASCVASERFRLSGVALETFLSEDHYRTTGDRMRRVTFELSPTGEVLAEVADGPASRT